MRPVKVLSWRWTYSPLSTNLPHALLEGALG